MILHGRDMYPFFRENLLRTLDLREVVIGDTNPFYLAAFYQRDKIRCPFLHIGRVVYPVDVDVIGGEAFETSCQHICYRILCIACNLRCELGRDKHILPLAVLCKCRKHCFRSSHAIHHGGIPEVQPLAIASSNTGFSSSTPRLFPNTWSPPANPAPHDHVPNAIDGNFSISIFFRYSISNSYCKITRFKISRL